MIDRFITYYNEVSLHQSLSYVTPVERHEGRHTVIIAARKEGMRRAREARIAADQQGSGSTPTANGTHRGPFRDRSADRGPSGRVHDHGGAGEGDACWYSSTKAAEGSERIPQ